ncbi:MAG: DUF2752 domain-containing protein [Actinobacteria bacterium]|nr:DUF2752 domain-containing protein [Actinomycetota bacterium]MCG2797861.1 DUF2752 domain-containing protein [Cellulomonas sp.]
MGAPVPGLLNRTRGPLAVAAGAAVLGAGLLLHDPGRAGSWGFCPLYEITGLYCPLCGGLRASADLLRGDVGGAWAMNPLWVLAVGPVVLIWFDWVRRRVLDRPAPVVPATVWWVVLGVALVFGVARNLPLVHVFLGPR